MRTAASSRAATDPRARTACCIACESTVKQRRQRRRMPCSVASTHTHLRNILGVVSTEHEQAPHSLGHVQQPAIDRHSGTVTSVPSHWSYEHYTTATPVPSSVGVVVEEGVGQQQQGLGLDAFLHSQRHAADTEAHVSDDVADETSSSHTRDSDAQTHHMNSDSSAHIHRDNSANNSHAPTSGNSQRSNTSSKKRPIRSWLVPFHASADSAHRQLPRTCNSKATTRTQTQ
jgi:hypothetical protein